MWVASFKSWCKAVGSHACEKGFENGFESCMNKRYASLSLTLTALLFFLSSRLRKTCASSY